jgi:hypothetical protein
VQADAMMPGVDAPDKCNQALRTPQSPLPQTIMLGALHQLPHTDDTQMQFQALGTSVFNIAA